MDIASVIREMPKVELHVHLEGAFSFEFLFKLVQRAGSEPSIHTIDDLKQHFVFQDFNHFIETWFWKNRFFQTADDFQQSTYYTLRELASQNVILVEAFFSPWDFQIKGLTAPEIIAATIAGKEAAEKDFGISCHLIADLVRDHGSKTALKRLDDVTPFLGRVIGIGLGGNESQFSAREFETVFRVARGHGFHVVAHAGEAAGPESIWEAVQILNVERVGHGIRAIEDASLLDYLKTKQIPLEICPTSNIKTRVVNSLLAHPLKDMYRQGLLVTINSDDPSMFGTTITQEFEELQRQLGFDWQDLRQLSLNAVQASFASEMEKRRLAAIINHYWTKIK